MMNYCLVNDELLKGITAESLTVELDSVALDWKPLRSVLECQCSTNFDHFMKKVSNELSCNE